MKELIPFLPTTDSKLNKELNGVNKCRYNQEILVTPDLAKEYLSTNVINNRLLRQGKIAQFVKDMKAGNWKRNTAEAIKFGISGNVIDGQHRLAAIIKSDKAIWLECAFNVPDENFDVLDSGSSRNPSDVFKIFGVPNGNVIPSIIYQYHILVGGNVSAERRSISSADLLNFYGMNPDYWQDVAKHVHIWYTSFSRILKPSIIGGVYAYLDGIDKEKAFSFFEQLMKPVNVDHSAIMLLKNKLIRDKMSVAKIKVNAKIGLMIKAWNHYRLNTPCKVLSFDPERERIPIAK